MGSYARQGIGFFTGDFSDRTTEAVERMRITKDGNVGIGIKSPSAKLHVYGKFKTKYLEIPEFVTKADATNNTSAVIGWSQSGILGIAGSLFLAPRTDLADAGIGFWTANQANLSSDPINRMYIKADGNVGIGTTIPSAKLHVNGTFRTRYLDIPEKVLKSDATNNTNAVIGWSESGVLGIAGSLFLAPRTNLAGAGIGFWTANQDNLSAEPINRMYIHANGNVGIGTTNIPFGYKLAVDGKAIFEEVKVEIINGADFVFEDDYNLRTIEEVAEYIKTEKHLPDVPSAKEMKENGIGVAEMNMKLLQKMEELTLYIIEQNKKIEAQNKRIEKLENNNLN